MKILIIGNGGREHALAWKVAQSEKVTHVFVAPGNAGTALEPKVTNIAIDALDIPQLIHFAKIEKIHLTIVGPEAPLAAGIVEKFQAQQLRCFGPTQKAAQLESSKAFSKAFMQQHGIPTAQYAVFSDIHAAKEYIKKQGTPIVIKADGLAAGKGVIIAQNEIQAFHAIDTMLADNLLGDAGNRVVIEEFLTGEEASFIVMCDGKHVLPLATSQDHKARDDGDKGPNTGGMGAYSPAPVITEKLQQRILEEIIQPTLAGMTADGHPYSGFLYAGLMITPEGEPKVLEYNCRLGDPEAQVILYRLQSDLVALCDAALDQSLQKTHAQWDPRVALGVVLASKGYPDNYQKGAMIENIINNSAADYKIFHAGTAQKNQHIVTNGGRVLCVTALGNTAHDAKQRAYEVIKTIHCDNLFYRTDIGYRAIARESGET